VKGYYKKDKQDGLWEYYNENKKSQEITFKNDIRHGPSRFFSPTGEVIFYHNYINDEIDSTAAYNWEESPGELSYTIKVISKSKHEFRIRRTELYNDNSTTTTYLVENENLDIFQTGIKDGSFSIKVKDELFVEGTYYDNLKSGLWIQYFYDLDLAYSSKWSADEIESEEFYNIGTNQPVSGKFRIHNYFNPGTEEVVKINNGIRHGKTIIYKDGVKLAVRKYKNGVLVK
jgi:antitoxin component YwqK of YwqJK toxin-antitoxin module